MHNSNILNRIDDKDTSIVIMGINQRIQEFNDDLAIKQANLKIIYNKKYVDTLAEQRLMKNIL